MPVYKRPGAKRDLVEQYVYLAKHAGLETAVRVLHGSRNWWRLLGYL